MKFFEQYLKEVRKIKPLGKLETREDMINDLSGEMVYIDGVCTDLFISHADYANWLEEKIDKNIFNDIDPKFKPGQWITYGGFSMPIKVLSIEDNNYHLERYDGTTQTMSIEFIDIKYRKWDIKDARMGDILIRESTEHMVMFKELLGNNNTIKYLCEIKDGELHVSYDIYNCDATIYTYDGQCFVPATKEQREYFKNKLKEIAK